MPRVQVRVVILLYAMATLLVPTDALPFVDVFGTESVQCSGAQIVATSKSLLVFGICAPNGQYPSKNLTINMKKSTDWGVTLTKEWV